MKTLYIEARRKLKLDRERLKEIEKILPDSIFITYIIQCKELAEQVRKHLQEEKKVKILGFSQVLGCSKLKTKADAILLIGNGRFHALNLALSSNKEVYIFPGMEKILREDIQQERRKEKGKYLRYLSANNIGIIVSSKTGQENLKSAIKLKKQIENKGKKAVIFIADNINQQELENFPIDIFINTACPGLSLDSNRIINYESVKK